MIAALAVFVVVLQFGPELAAALGFGSESAWQYVASGLESAALWTAVALFVRGLGSVAAWWAAVEGAERAGCRLAFDMATKPATNLPLCDAALGVPASGLSVVVAIALAGLIEWSRDAR